MDALQQLRDLALSDSGFVFDPCSGSTFSTNPAGTTILKGLAQGLGREEILALLEERFEVGGHDLARDLYEFVHLLRQLGLVTHDFHLESRE